MASPPASALTQLLDAAAQGDAAAVERFWSAAYGEVHALAKRLLARESPDCSLQATALVNEAYMRLSGGAPLNWENRRHFFGAAAIAMRRILVEHAREKGRSKRRFDRALVPLANEPAGPTHDLTTVLAVDEALAEFERIDALAAQVVNLRYFAGLGVDETAAALDVAPKTVDNKWRTARAWLHRELSKGDSTWASKG
jgi:RNA polymerase sigma factor (TIGR02999 family)